ncbi:MAG: PAS domain-containing protein [Sandaracinaceae bacterium]|nr:PAS domain-containing protein [Sandaracinaceae bacterium]
MPETLPLRRRQLWLLGGRLAVATLLLGGYFFFGDRPGGFTQDALLALISATFAVSLASLVALPRVGRPDLLVAAQLVYDLGLVTGLVYLFGGVGSGFSFLYGVVILASAILLGARAAQLVTATALVLYLVVGIGLANEWIPPPPDAPEMATDLPLDALGLNVLRTLVGLILVGVLAGGLAERLQRAGGQLREVEQSAAEYATLNEDILRSLASGLLTTDLEGVIVRINPAGAALLGGAPDALEGQRADTLLPFDPAAQKNVERGDGTARRIDGSTFPVGFSCSPLRDGRGEHRGSLVLFSDLTELTTLRQKAERAERLAALGRLAAGLAHEIRNPLGSISGSVELVREAADLDPEDARLLSLVLDEVDRLDALVTTMLDVGRPREPELTSVDLGALVDAVAKVVRPTTPIAIRVQAPPDPVRALGDPGQLRQVIWNLLKNALQFSPPGGEVRVEVGWDEDARPRIAVSDDGPGIEAEDMEHLFDMFFTKRRHGVGLGLALVRQIVEAHRGRVVVDSRPGEGSTFSVHLSAAGIEERASTPHP